MPTPLISGDPEAQAFLREYYRRMHEYNLFAWKQRMTKKEAHAAAWQAMRARFGR